MLYNFLTSLAETYPAFFVFNFLTFRTGLALGTSLTIAFIIGGPLIKIFSKNQITGPIRMDGPIDHIVKKTGSNNGRNNYCYQYDRKHIALV